MVGLPAISLMPVMAPLVSAASAVLLLVFLRRLGIDVRVAAIASFLFAVSGSEAVISAGVTKEAFAIPLLFAFLILLENGLRGSNTSSGLALLTFAALLAYHHLTAVVALSLSIFLVIVYAMRPDTRRRSLTAGVPVVLAGLAFASVYLLWYSFKALNITFGPTDAISVLAYEGVAVAPLLYSFSRGFRGTRPLAVWMGLIYVGVIAVLSLGSRYTVFILAPQTTTYAMLLVGPYLLAGFLAVVAATRKELLASPEVRKAYLGE